MASWPELICSDGFLSACCASLFVCENFLISFVLRALNPIFLLSIAWVVSVVPVPGLLCGEMLRFFAKLTPLSVFCIYLSVEIAT